MKGINQISPMDSHDQSEVELTDDENFESSRGLKMKTDRTNRKDSAKSSNTIMQQINSFSKIPMNDSLAEQTIVDHKYLLESVENRCAIAFYAVSSRNHSLYLALQRFYRY